MLENKIELNVINNIGWESVRVSGVGQVKKARKGGWEGQNMLQSIVWYVKSFAITLLYMNVIHLHYVVFFMKIMCNT